jgi:MFS family permease
MLVCSRDATLPDSCVKCNLPTDEPGLKRNLTWHHPLLYLLILGGFLIYVIVAAILSKRATLFIGLCADHRRQRRQGMLIGWLLFGGGLLGAILALANDYIGVMIVCLLCIPVGLVWLIIAARTVTVKKIDDRFVWLKGINPDYLAALPPFPW